jgi:hypothetical protein
MQDQPKIMYHNDEAAQKVTVTGWLSRRGHFYGDNEHLARWDGCTHLICGCGAEMERSYTSCAACRDKKRLENYEAMPFKEWDGQTPLTLYDDDEYFWEEDGLLDHCEMNEINPEDLRLVICKPNYAWEIDDDDYRDILAKDHTLADTYPELADDIEKVNELIRKKEMPLSWGAGKYRSSYSAKRQAA